jgi:hypothetical protein
VADLHGSLLLCEGLVDVYRTYAERLGRTPRVTAGLVFALFHERDQLEAEPHLARHRPVAAM